MGFGKYYDITVSMVLSLNPGYIIWSYFHIETIGYSNEVLDYIEIAKEFRFDKPGINEIMWDKFREHLYSNETQDEKESRKQHEIFVRNEEEWSRKALRALSQRIRRRQSKTVSLSKR